ncbi:MAG: hypothetical protein QNJ68_03490 [Microcoleaceae cyanobacterium MO_207.B10]|nr:hypothetical protein [Microcoleaceae cyanobacterium MO_207.B10]
MNKRHEKEQTQGTWGVQGDNVGKPDNRSSSGPNEHSRQDGIESFSTSGENRTGGYPAGVFLSQTVGKIIDRLIDSWRDREKEASDCLEWYQNQIEKCQEEINSLEDIKAELTEKLEH